MSDLIEYDCDGFVLTADQDKNEMADQWVIHFMKAYFNAGFLNDIEVTINNKYLGDSNYKLVIDAESNSYEIFAEGGLNTEVMKAEGLV